MSDINTSDYVGRFEFVEFGSKVPEGDFARFVVTFIKELLKSFQLENETFPSSKPGRKPYALHKMASLVYYSYSRGFTKASIIADMAKYHHHFQFVANGIEPDEDTINDFIKIWGSFFEYLVSYTVQFSKISNLTTFHNLSLDSTFAKSNNNKFNVMYKDDVEVLIRYYSSKLVEPEELEALRFPARRFINREDMSNKEKLVYLTKILKRFDETGANTIPVNDIDAIHIYNKQGLADVGYSVQTAVDNESKLFVSLIVSQNATDHYQLPEIMDKSIINMGMYADYSCVDAGYNTRRTLEYINERGINVLMDNNRSAKLRNGHANSNDFHKDNMDYDATGDFYTCYNNEKLTYQRTRIRWDEKKKDYVIECLYFNKEACANCKFAEECCNNEYRVVTLVGGSLAKDMLLKFEDYENIIEYVKRFSTVEAPNGTLKRFYHINELLTPGVIKSQNRVNICGGSYNMIRLYHLFMEMDGVDESNILDVVKIFCDYTNAVMPIWRNTSFPFMDEILQLPYICESCLMNESEEVGVDESQMRLDGLMV